jgi:hypothetical protein
LYYLIYIGFQKFLGGGGKKAGGLKEIGMAID